MQRIHSSKLILLIALLLTTVFFASCGSQPVSTEPGSTTKAAETSTAVQPETGTAGDVTTQPEDTGKPAENTGKPAENTGKPAESTGKPAEGTGEKPFPDIQVKGLYLTGYTVGDAKKRQHFIDLADQTEINAYVVDIKDDDGMVGYESSIPQVRELGAWQNKYNADKVIQDFHDHGIYVIGRLVCFKDPQLSSKRPELAIKTTGGALYRDRDKLSWLSPYNRNSWPYLAQIAKEAVQKGFDEIQLDYVRFANDGNKKAMDFGDSGGKERDQIINEFLAYMKKEVPQVPLSADVFGIISESPGDSEKIGQNLEFVGREIDFISPMLYPSHYALGQSINGVIFKKPDLAPYEVVYQALTKTKRRISAVKDYKAEVRPYIQDFTAKWLKEPNYQVYGPQQVQQQIKAVYDAGYRQWICWNAGNKYSESAFIKE